MKPFFSPHIASSAANGISKKSLCFLLWLGICLVSLLSVASAQAGSKVIYVNATQSVPARTETGASWATAYRSLDAALLSAGSSRPSAVQPVEIWIAQGTYVPAAAQGFQLQSHIRLVGGFAGTETTIDQRRLFGHATVLSGDLGKVMTGAVTHLNLTPATKAFTTDPGWLDNAQNVLVGNNVTNVVLDGLTITGGAAVSQLLSDVDIDGMELYLDTGVLGVRSSTVVPVSPTVTGGGLFFSAPSGGNPSLADLIINNCTFTRNQARGYGGAMAIRDAQVIITASTFSENTSNVGGGAIWALNTTFNVESCAFNDNFSLTSGGAVDIKAVPTIFNHSPTLASSEENPLNTIADKLANIVGIESDYNGARKRLGYGLAILGLAKKGASVVATPGSVGTKFKTALPANPLRNDLSAGSKFMASYAIISLTVTGMDVGVWISEYLGADPHGPFIEQWTVISKGFNKYATPQGLVTLGTHAAFEAAGFNSNNLSDVRSFTMLMQQSNYNGGPYSFFSGCRFNRNTTTGEGGAFSVTYANSHLEGCWFQENSAMAGGGAIFSSGWTTPRVINSVFYRNSSTNGHTAIANFANSRMQVLGCTFYQNSGNSTRAAALSAELGSSVRLSNSILWGNTNGDAPGTGQGADLFCATASTLDPTSKGIYDTLKGEQSNWVGTMDVWYCDIQSLGKLPVGYESIDIFPRIQGSLTNAQIAQQVAYYRQMDISGDADLANFLNAGEGFRPTSNSEAQPAGSLSLGNSNFSLDPQLGTNPLAPVTPSRYSPVIDRGSDQRLRGQFSQPLAPVDVLGNRRISGGHVDVGAVEVDLSTGTGERIYIKPTATGNGSGSSWANASANLGAAMSTAGAEVWVAEGTYHPSTTDRTVSYTLAAGTQVIGGFAGTETARSQRSWQTRKSIISGEIGTPAATDNSRHLVRCIGTPDAPISTLTILDGLYFQGSYSVDGPPAAGSDGGGAILCLNASPTIQNCVFSDNTARYGGAIYSNFSGQIQWCANLSNCQFYRNSVTEDGGAIWVNAMWHGDNLIFSGNTATNGGAIAARQSGDGNIQQSLFYGNTSTGGVGGAIYAVFGGLSVNSSTFYGNSTTVNQATPAGGAAIYRAQPGNGNVAAEVKNSIFYNNTVTNSGTGGVASMEQRQIDMAGSANVLLLSNSLLQGLNKYAGNSKSGNIDADPQFLDAAAGNFRLAGNSPAINAGSNDVGAYIFSTDLGSSPRLVYGVQDIGPYEYQGAIPPIDPATALGTTTTQTTTVGPMVSGSASLTITIVTTVNTGIAVTSSTTANTSYTSDPSLVSGISTSFIASTATPPVGGQLVVNKSFSNDAVVNTFTVIPPLGSSDFAWQVNDGNGWKAISNNAEYKGATTTTLTITAPPYSQNGYQYRLTYSVAGFSLLYYSPTATLRLAPPVIYVNAQATETGTNDGLSWATAYPNLKTALDAVQPGSAVWVATGTYYPRYENAAPPYDTSASFALHSGVAVYGGFAGTETALAQRDPAAHLTLLSGSLGLISGNKADPNSQHLFNNNGNYQNGVCDRSAVLDGFTLSGASQEAMINTKASPTIRNCIFQENLGSAISNSADSNPLIANCQFLNNRGRSGAGVFCNGGSVTIENSLFAGNAADYHGAVHIQYATSPASITNCTFANNTAAASGAAIYEVSSTLYVQNSILWGNTVGDLRATAYVAAVDKQGGSFVFSNDCIQGGASLGNGCIAYDPLFAGAATGDFSLSSYSPLIDAGSSPRAALSSTMDLAGNPRQRGSSIDIGAYESQSTASSAVKLNALPPASVSTTNVGGSVSFTASAVEGSGIVFGWQIDFNDGNGFVTITNGDRYQITNGGSTLTLTGITTGDNNIKVRITIPGSSYVGPPSVLTVVSPRIIYVNKYASAPDYGLTPDGTSWFYAYRDLDAALANARAGDEIWVSQAVYSSTNGAFALPPNVAMYGGFSGTEYSRTQRNWQSRATILEPGSSGGILSCRSAAGGVQDRSTVIDGFVFQHAGTGQAALYNLGRNLAIFNSTFTGNSISAAHFDAQATFTNCEFNANTGTAISSNHSTVTLSGCRIRNNAVINGAPVENTSSSTLLVTDCSFLNNSGQVGGIKNFDNSSVSLLRSTFQENSGPNGGALCNDGSSVMTMESSLFVRNQTAQNGGALMNFGGKVTILGSTFYNNFAQVYGGAIESYSGVTPALVANSIFWNNRIGSSGASVENAQIDLTYSQVSVRNSIVEGLSALSGSGNLPYSPLFTNPDAGDFSLDARSPAINAGDASVVMSSTTDLAGAPRVAGTAPDLGAYEFQSTAASSVRLTAQPQSSALLLSGSTSLTITLASGSGNTVQWQIFDTDSQSWVNAANTSDYQFVASGSSSTLSISLIASGLSGTQFRVIVGGFTSAPIVLTVKQPQIIYVDGGITGSGDGSSWAKAFRTIQDAATAARSASSTTSSQIWVKAGTYAIATPNQPFPLTWDVQLYGGFKGTETALSQRDWVANVVTLTAQGSGNLINNSGGSYRGYGHPLLDGVTLAGSIAISSADPIFQHCTFKGDLWGTSVGVASDRYSNPTFKSCTFADQTTTALSISGGNGSLEDCLFQNNSSYYAVLLVYGGTTTITNTVFTGNSGPEALGVVGGNSPPKVVINRSQFIDNSHTEDMISMAGGIGEINNSLLAQNQLTTGAAVTMQSGTLTLAHSTITDNTSASEEPGIRARTNGRVFVKNSVLWGNRGAKPASERYSSSSSNSTRAVEEDQLYVETYAPVGTITATRSIIQGLTQFAGNNNLAYDPLFIDPIHGNYRLSSVSPAIDQGDAAVALATGPLDLAGSPRTSGPLPDLGAYEFSGTPGSPLKLSSDFTTRRIIQGGYTSFTVAPPAGSSIQWQISTNGGATFTNVVPSDTMAVNGNSLTISNARVDGYQYRYIISGNVSYTSAAALVKVVPKPVVYVNALATGSHSGTNWANAYTSIDAALETRKPVEIWVAKGTYLSSTDYGIYLTRGVEVYGGFTGNETVRSERNPSAHISTLGFNSTATSQNSLVYYGADGDASFGNPIFDGFTLTGPGAGIRIVNGSMTVSQCQFIGLGGIGIYNGGGTTGTVIENSMFDGGANSGVFCTNNSQLTIQGCTFQNGYTQNYGGAITCYSTTLSIRDSLFLNNTLNGSVSGGAIYVMDATGNLDIQRCQFFGNTSPSRDGGAIATAGKVTIRDSLFVGNRASRGGAISNTGTLNLRNVTLSGNSADDGGGGVFQYSGALSVINSILWNNTIDTNRGHAADWPQIAFTGGIVSTSYSTIQNNVSFSGEGNVNYDPLLVGGDASLATSYALTAYSPGIGVGDTTALLAGETDLAGKSRVTSGKTDLGAYQMGLAANPVYLAMAPATVSQVRGGNATFSVTGSAGATFGWEFNTGSGWMDISKWSGVQISISTSASGANRTSTLTLIGVTESLSGVQFRATVPAQSYATGGATLLVIGPKIIYVDASAREGGDGMTWATAYRSFSQALGAITPIRREINIAEGTYPTSFTYYITTSTEIYGGFPAGGAPKASRDPVNHPTILAGSPFKTLVEAYSVGPDTVIDGLTLQNANFGLFVYNASPTLRNLVIRNNNLGVSFFNCSGALDRSRIVDNFGTGVAAGNSTMTFSNSIISGNFAGANSSSGTERGGGMALRNGNYLLQNLVITGNVASDLGGGIEFEFGQVRLVNCTISGNRARVGGGLYSTGSSWTIIQNSVFWGNQATSGGPLEAQQFQTGNGSILDIEASDIEGLSAYAGNGNIEAYPIFASPIEATDAPTTAGNFQINPASPLVNRGNNAFPQAFGIVTDITGANRFVGTVDIGAYESQTVAAAPLVITSQPANFIFNRTASNSLSVQASGADEYLYQWEVAAPGSSVFVPIVDGALYGGAQTSTLRLLSMPLDGTRYRVRITVGNAVVYSRPATSTVVPFVYYVNANRPDDNGDGKTWSSAFKTVGTSLEKMQVDPYVGAQLWVAAGTYIPKTSLSPKNNVALYGGFTGTETTLSQRDAVANPTTISGANMDYSIFTNDGNQNYRLNGVRIDGFALIDSPFGIIIDAEKRETVMANCVFKNITTAGILMASRSAMNVENCRFINSKIGITCNRDGTVSALNTEFHSNSEGVNLQDGTLNIQHCSFRSNTASGIRTNNPRANLTILDSAFTSNAQGIIVAGGTVSIQCSSFRGNGSGSVVGGGLAIAEARSTVSVENSLFSGNVASSGGAIGANYDYAWVNLTLRNCTITANYATGSGGGIAGVYPISLYNSIVWGNASAAGNDESQQVKTYGTITAQNNNIQNANAKGVFANNNTISIAPAFAQPIAASPTPSTAGDFQLTYHSSLLVDGGITANGGASATDLAGRPRVYGSAVDLGAYEYQGTVLKITRQPVDGYATRFNPARFDIAINLSSATYQWQRSSDEGGTFANIADAPGISGATTSTLTISPDPSLEQSRYRVIVTTPDAGVETSAAAIYHYMEFSVIPPISTVNATLTGTTSSISFASQEAVLPASLNDSNIAIHAMETGRLSLADGSVAGVSVNSGTVTLNTAVPFHAGERVEVTTTQGIQTAGGLNITPRVWEFYAATRKQTGIFTSPTPIGTGSEGVNPAAPGAMAIGDLYGEGTLDLVLGGTDGAHILFSSGTSQQISSGVVTQVVLGSLGMIGTTGNRGDLDILLTKADGSLEIWRNEGAGDFTQVAGITGSHIASVALADLNGDGALDLFVATSDGSGSQVWLNNGSGVLTDSGQRLGTTPGISVAIGDLNLDGAMDVVVAGGTKDLKVWLNDGTGHFTAGPAVPNSPAERVFLRDMNGNHSLDLIAVTSGSSAKFWMGNGSAQFTPKLISGIGGGSSAAFGIADFDGDGAPDIVAAGADGKLAFYRNSNFSFTPFPFAKDQPDIAATGLAIADMDGDGALDIISVAANGTPGLSHSLKIDLSAKRDQAIPLTRAVFTQEFTAGGSGRTLASIQIVSLPEHATLTLSGVPVTLGQVIPASSLDLLVLVPNADWNGATAFNWLGSAGAGYDAKPYSLRFLILFVPHNVVANGSAFTVLQGGTATTLASGAGSVLDNAVNIDGRPLIAKLVTGPAHGALTFNADGTFVYIHDNSQTLADQFTYKATNSDTGLSDTAVVAITITHVNQPPTDITVDRSKNYPIYEGIPGTVGALHTADPDPEDQDDDSHVYTLVSGPGYTDNAFFQIFRFYFLSNPNMKYADGATRKVRIRSTDSGGLFVEKEFTIEVRSLPQALSQSVTMKEDDVATIVATATNADGRPVTSFTVGTAPQNGTVMVNGAHFSYKPNSLFHGTDSFVFNAAGENPYAYTSGTVTITVEHVNHPPLLTLSPLTTDENTPLSFNVEGSDPDGDPLTYRVTALGMGTVTATGSTPNFIFTPPTDRFGTYPITIVANDGEFDSAPASTTITINKVALPPIADPSGTAVLQNESGSFELKGRDRNGDPLTYRLVTQPQNGILTGTPPDLTYFPNRNYHGTETFFFVANNGTYDSEPGTVAIKVIHVNQPPLAFPQAVTTNQDQPVAITLTGTSIENALTFRPASNPKKGLLTGTGADLLYTPGPRFSGTDQFDFTALDGLGGTSTATVFITVNKVYHKPTATSGTITFFGDRNTPVVLSGSDVDGMPLTYTIQTAPEHGDLVGSMPDKLIYITNPRYFGSDSLTYTVSNGQLESDEATIIFNVEKEIAPPIVQPTYGKVFPLDTVTIDVLANASDTWDAPLIIQNVSQPLGGTGTVTNTGTSLVYTNTDADSGGNGDFISCDISNGTYTTKTFVYISIVNPNLVVTSPEDSGPGTLRSIVSLIDQSFKPSGNWKVTIAPRLASESLQLTTADPTDPRSALTILGNITLSSSFESPMVIAVNGASPMRAFHIARNGTLRLNGFSITGGRANQGGAVLNEGTFSFANGTISGNTAAAEGGRPGMGGAIFNRAGLVEMTDATVFDNTADIAGGLYQIGDGSGASASAVIVSSTFYHHGTAGDFFSTGTNGGTSSIDATAFFVETPSAPWFGALPVSETIANRFALKVPVLLDQDAYTLTASSTNGALSNISWSGRGASRTLTLSGFAPAPAETFITAAASDGVTSYVQHTAITIDPNSARPPIAHDDAAAVPVGGSVLIPVLANDVDPDGSPLTIIAVTNGQSGRAIISGSAILYTQKQFDATEDSFRYTIQNAAGLTATANVAIRVSSYNLSVALGNDDGWNTLRTALDTVNQYYAPNGWRITFDGDFLANSGTAVIPRSVGDRSAGNSAYLITGHVTIDGAAVPGLTILRDGAAPSMRLFRVTEEGQLTLANLTVDGGRESHGGLILNEGITQLDNATLQNGSAALGGALFNEGTVDTNVAILQLNTASRLGGALYNRNAIAYLQNATLANNTALDGGGIHIQGDDGWSEVRVLNGTLHNPGAAHDLSAAITGTGRAVYMASHTSVATPADFLVQPIDDRPVDENGETLPFTYHSLSPVSLSAMSLNQSVIPNSSLSLSEITPTSGKLTLGIVASGYADVALLATKDGISFGQFFQVTANSSNNQPPVAVTDYAEVYEGESITINVLENDYDPEGASLKLVSVGTAAHGTVAISGSSVIYTHDGSTSTSDTFTYTISDGFGGMATGTVHITIIPHAVTVISPLGYGRGSLASALDYIAAHPISGTWTVVFDPSLANQTITNEGAAFPYHNGYTLYHIYSRIRLDGSQAPGLTFSNITGPSNPPVRYFHINQGASLELNSLTFKNGYVYSFMSETGLGGGGAVLNNGTLIANDLHFINCRTWMANVGGAIANDGTALITDCTFTNNQATAGYDNSALQLGTGLGGAIFDANGGVTVVNSTFTDNIAETDGASIYVAGAGGEATLQLAGSVFTQSDPDNHPQSQIKLFTIDRTDEGGDILPGTVIRSGSNNTVPAGEAAPWIASGHSTIELIGPTDIPLTLGLPDAPDSYTLSASASPVTLISDLALHGVGPQQTLSVVPASGLNGSVDLTVRLVVGPVTINETFGAVVAGHVSPPAAPTQLTATSVSDTQILLQWTDNALGETHYTLERSANGTDGWVVLTSSLAAGATHTMDATMAPMTTAFYRVRCTVGIVPSEYSNIANAATAATIGDGIPGYWRYQYFGDGTRVVPGSEADADFNGNGISNLNEYLAGTDPTNAINALIPTLQRTGINREDVTISFPTITGKTYLVETTASLTTPVVWTRFASDITGTTGSSAQVTDPHTIGTVPQRFYRCAVQVSGSAVAHSNPVGFSTVQGQANSDTDVGIPFARPAEYFGTIAAVAESTLTVNRPPGWATNQWVRQPGTQPNTYYVLIGVDPLADPASNPAAGRIYPVLANTGGGLTLDTLGNDLPSIPEDTPISIIPYWTLNTIMPAADANRSFVPTPSSMTLKSQVLLPNTTGTGINLSPVQTFYYITNGTNIGWRQFGASNTVDVGDTILPPGSWNIFRNHTSEPLPITFSGTVLTRRISLRLRTQTTSAQDNFASVPRPVDTTLDNLGLNPDDGSFASTRNSFAITDQLLVLSNATQGMNRSPAATYYYLSSGSNIGWRKVGDLIATDHGSDIIPAGAAFIIRKGKTPLGTDLFWNNNQ